MLPSIMIHTLTSKVNERKSKLDNYLTNNSDLTKEKKHQMKGAMKELDKIHKLIQSHKHQEVHLENNPDEVFLFKPMQDKNFLHQAKQFVKDLF